MKYVVFTTSKDGHEVIFGTDLLTFVSRTKDDNAAVYDRFGEIVILPVGDWYQHHIAEMGRH